MTDAKMEQARREYLESRALSAQPVEVVHMLYEIAINNLNAAIACLEEGDAFARSRAVTKAEEAIQELVLALDHSVHAPFTRTLEDLYRYVLSCIVKGHASKSKQSFENARSVLTTLAAAWAQIKDEDVKRPQTTSAVEEPESPVGSHAVNPYGSYSVSASSVGGSRDWTG